jgi:hypothetical protein
VKLPHLTENMPLRAVTIDKRDYHQQSHFGIADDKWISQHLSVTKYGSIPNVVDGVKAPDAFRVSTRHLFV